LVIFPVYGFLIWDAPSLPIADLGPRVDDSDIGYRTVMWMAEKSPYSRLQEPGVINAEDLQTWAVSVVKGDWPTLVPTKREQIVKAWEADQLGKQWIDAVNKTPPKGVWPQGINSPIISYKPVRATCYIHTMYAYLLAIDGRYDEAMAALLPMIQAMQSIERTNGNIVHEMIANVVTKTGYSAAAEIMKRGTLSAGTRVKFREVLNAAPTPQQNIRHAFLGEHEFLRGCMDAVEGKYAPLAAHQEGMDRWIDLIMKNGGKWILFNRNRTERMGLTALTQISTLAEARDLEGLKRWEPDWDKAHSFRNPAGRMVIAVWMPGFSKLVPQIWEVDDMRLDLLKQLEKP
jgi:hypothetical protein